MTTTAVADAPVAASPARARRGNSVLLLLAPSLILLFAVLLLPLTWFFISTMGSLGTAGEIALQVWRTLSSGVVLNALLFTVLISAMVTVCCLVVAYPMSYCLLIANRLVFTILITCVVLPYFVSTIVRTYAWMVLLGRNGILNQMLLHVGLLSEPLKLMYNASAIILGMVYVLLPYMVLTLYASMRNVDSNLIRAAESLGAGGIYTFRRVFFPLTLPGIVSGSLIIFILALGFFVTPALMGSPKNVTVAMLVEREVEINLNWPMASIVSLLLFVVTLILYSVYYRFANVDKMLSQEK